MRIREFTDADEATCADIFARGWAHAFPQHPREIDAETFIHETDGELVLVAEQDGRVIGFAALFEPESFLHHLYVDPDHHREGVGRALLGACVARAKMRLTLKAQINNAGARAFYAHLGYTEHERGDDPYGAWVLIKAPA